MASIRKHPFVFAVGGATVGVALLAGVIGGGIGVAQDATPDTGTMASPVASPMASPMASPVADSAGQAVTVTMVDIAFDPKEFTIPANTDTTVDLPNTGAAPHNFNIDALNVHSETPDGGAATQVTINGAAGDYEYYCNVPGHKQAGMVGTLTIQ